MPPIPKVKGRSVPECVRCRNHGHHVNKRGHKKDCRYNGCECEKCILLKERKDVESKIKIAEQKDKLQTNDKRSNQKTADFKTNDKLLHTNNLSINCSFLSSAQQSFMYQLQYQTGFVNLSNYPSVQGKSNFKEIQQNNNIDLDKTDKRSNTDHSINSILKNEQTRNDNGYTRLARIGPIKPKLITNTGLTFHQSYIQYIPTKGAFNLIDE